MIFIFCAFFIQPFALSIAAEDPRIELMEERLIPFTSDAPSDILRVKISGQKCSKATLRISIFNRKGVELYKFETPFMDFLEGISEDSDFNEVAIYTAHEILNRGMDERTSSLPEWKSEDEVCDVNTPATDIATYNKFRKQNLPTFSHPTHYEGWRSIVYDKEKNMAVVLIEGGS